MWSDVSFIVCLPAIMVTTAMELELVSILPYGLYGAQVAPALVFTGAALDVAIAKANTIYKPALNISLSLLYGSPNQTCDDVAANVIDLLAGHYYRARDRNICMAVVGASMVLLLNSEKKSGLFYYWGSGLAVFRQCIL